MIYERFFKWLFRNRHCEHEWVETNVSYNVLRTYSLGTSGFRHHSKCKNCGKKIRRTPRNTPSNYIRY